jgi:hypothetical protein
MRATLENKRNFDVGAKVGLAPALACVIRVSSPVTELLLNLGHAIFEAPEL